MYKNPKYFYKHVILHNNQIHNSYYLNNLIPKEWQLILLNDGSFTKTLTSLTGQKTNIHILGEYTYKLISNKKKEKYGYKIISMIN